MSWVHSRFIGQLNMFWTWLCTLEWNNCKRYLAQFLRHWKNTSHKGSINTRVVLPLTATCSTQHAQAPLKLLFLYGHFIEKLQTKKTLHIIFKSMTERQWIYSSMIFFKLDYCIKYQVSIFIFFSIKHIKISRDILCYMNQENNSLLIYFK